jgi:hypothetical protein
MSDRYLDIAQGVSDTLKNFHATKEESLVVLTAMTHDLVSTWLDKVKR